MEIENKEYSKIVKAKSPPSPIVKDTILAFLTGGIICTFGQLLTSIYETLPLTEKGVKALVPMTLIFVTAALTSLGVFDKIAKVAGAGTLVPITGFANAVVSPAIEYKAEGFVLGVGANMFKIAGPVIAFGTVGSVVYGIIYWIITLF